MKGKPTLKESLILEAIPRDKWVRANEIAEKTGLNAQAVGLIISHNLHAFIERKKFTDSSNRIYLYKRMN